MLGRVKTRQDKGPLFFWVEVFSELRLINVFPKKTKMVSSKRCKIDPLIEKRWNKNERRYHSFEFPMLQLIFLTKLKFIDKKNDKQCYEGWATRTLYKDEEEMSKLMLEYLICISFKISFKHWRSCLCNLPDPKKHAPFCLVCQLYLFWKDPLF